MLSTLSTVEVDASERARARRRRCEELGLTEQVRSTRRPARRASSSTGGSSRRWRTRRTTGSIDGQLGGRDPRTHSSSSEPTFPVAASAAARRRVPHVGREGPGREDLLRPARGTRPGCASATLHDIPAELRNESASSGLQGSPGGEGRDDGTVTAPDAEHASSRNAARRGLSAKERTAPAANRPRMAARRKKRPLRPRVPSRVEEADEADRARNTRTSCSVSRSLALGLGARRHPLPRTRRRRRRLVARRCPRQRSSATPPTLCRSRSVALGGLLLARSDLSMYARSGWGWASSFLGLMTLLGKDTGGWIGMAIGGTIASLIGDTGAAIIGGALLVAGPLLVDGRIDGRDPAPHGSRGEAGRDGRTPRVRVGRRASRRPRRTSRRPARVAATAAVATEQRLLDGAEAFPGRGGCGRLGRGAPRTRRARARVRRASSPSSRRRPNTPSTDCRTGPSARVARGRPLRSRDASAKIADLLVRTLSEFGVDATVTGQISGPRVTRYELQLAPGHEGVEGRRAQGRPLLCARHDGDPHPGADSGQTGRRRGGPEPLAKPRHARRHLRRSSCEREPAVRLARQGHLGERRLDRSRAHAAPPHRRHHRLGQVGLHQHDPHLDAPALDAGRGADDPHRPEADRARLLRVDPASPDTRRLEPEGSRDRAPERRAEMERRYERLSFVRARSLPEANRAFRARERRRFRTCSSSSTSWPT